MKQLQDLLKISSTVVMFYHTESLASLVLKDYIVFQYCALNKIKQPVTKTKIVYLCQVTKNKQIAELYKIKRYPTTIVINQDEKAIKTVIGALIHTV